MRKRTLNYIFYGILSIVIIAFGIVSFKPIIKPSPRNCVIITGTVEQIWASDENHDINIRLQGSDVIYYINRGLESELRTYDLKSLIGQNIQIYAVKHWTILDPKRKVQHIACIKVGEESLYSEFCK